MVGIDSYTWQDGSKASELADVDLNVEHMEIIGLENLIASLHLVDNLSMGF